MGGACINGSHTLLPVGVKAKRCSCPMDWPQYNALHSSDHPKWDGCRVLELVCQTVTSSNRTM